MLKWITFLITLGVSSEALADVYKYVDSSGRAYYTNIKPKSDNNGYKRIMETKSYRYMRPAPTMAGYRSYFGQNRQKFSELINAAAYRHQVDPRLVHAVIQTESAYNAGAVSSAGAV